MKWIGKAAGGLIGALVLGPLGAALGLLLGHQFDEDSGPAPEPLSHEDLTALGERFFRATFRIMGYLAKADGRVSEQEIAAARAVMSELRLDAAQTQQAIACFTAGKQPQFDFDAELEGLQRACRGRTDLTRIFLEIQVRAALAGNNLEGRVRAMMQHVAQRLQISAFEMAHIEAVLRIRAGAFHSQGAPGGGAAAAGDPGLAGAYRVLETSAQASDAEVAKAYRRALNRHHPDKLKANGLPDSMVEHAKQRTQQIIEAWELIRTRRGIR
jgi:DnaJ like chaperone protein